MTNDSYSYCPLINNRVCDGECYDVQMVRSHMIVESVLDFVVDRAKADIVCDKCSFNQLSGAPKAVKPKQEGKLAYVV